MANLKGMSGLDIHAMVSEAQGFLPFWVGKTYQYDTGMFGIRLNGEDKQKFSLIIEIGKRVHFTSSLPAATANPSGYSMFLRKYCNGGRVLGISQPGGIERVVDIEIGKSGKRFHLIIELFDEGNIILTDGGDYTIIQPLKNIGSKTAVFSQMNHTPLQPILHRHLLKNLLPFFRLQMPIPSGRLPHSFSWGGKICRRGVQNC